MNTTELITTAMWHETAQYTYSIKNQAIYLRATHNRESNDSILFTSPKRHRGITRFQILIRSQHGKKQNILPNVIPT